MYIEKVKEKGDYYNYYLTEYYYENDIRKKRHLTSFGREPPVFYKPNLVNDLCENYLKEQEPASVDLIIDDPPYGLTNINWDRAPDWSKLSELYSRVLRDDGLVYVFGRQPSLIEIYNCMSKFFDFRFEVIWNRKNSPHSTDFKPMATHENIFVFCKKGTPAENTKFYIDKVMTNGKPYSYKRGANSKTHNKYSDNSMLSNGGRKRYPKSVLEIPYIYGTSEYCDYPTQKPLELIRWIILASSKRDDMVLDPHVGSGTTLVASLYLGRKSIGVEASPDAYNIADNRVLKDVNKLPKDYLVKDV